MKKQKESMVSNMSRYDIKSKSANNAVLGFEKFNLKTIQEDIELLHFYDSKQNEKDSYYVFDNKLNKIVYSE